jgi:glucose/arabinose dehydrogenase
MSIRALRGACRWTVLATITVGYSLFIGQALAASAFECRWTDTPPVLDGQGEDLVWQRAAPVDNFAQPWVEGAPHAKARTSARLLWDREYLYFYAQMEDTDVVAEVREHDGPMWENDVFELFFRPAEKYAGYYEFEVNPAEAVLDAFFPTAESWKDPEQIKRGTFHLDAKVAVRGTLNAHDDTDAGWAVEGRIPWSDFLRTGGRPTPGETWRVNLARVNGAGAAGELSSAAPLTKLSFHRTDEFAALRFVGPDPLPRESWENKRLIGSPEGPAEYVTRREWPQLSARFLVAIVPVPGSEWLWFIQEEGYRENPMKLRRFRRQGDGGDAETLLDLPDYAYDVAFHPRFAENGFVFIGANGPHAKTPRSSRVLRYTVRDGRPDPASRTPIIEWSSDGHNGCALAFATDGTLFVSSGDGTGDSDTDHAGQDTHSLRAKILRIDVDHPAEGKLYSVPRDNPFVGDARFAPETWAYGLRNPWRLTFDSASGQLWSGENGQDSWEYARLVQRGANYGWSRYEGGHDFREIEPLGPQPVTFPTIEHSHSEFRSLSGGVVYRGKQFPALVGAYIYGDFGTGRLWAARHDGARLEWDRELCDTPLAITHVTADADGELLIADYGTGAAGGGIHRLASAPPPTPAPPFPAKLSETGLFTDVEKLAPERGVLRYEINEPAWHDGAVGEYYLALPADGTIEVTPVKSWQPPDGTTLAQTLTLGGRRIETRILLKQQNDWAGYTYVWNSAQTDAALADKGGADFEIANGEAKQSWRVPSRAECLMCHSRQANFALTLHEAQLNHGEQLALWERLGLLRVDVASFEHEHAPQFPNQRSASSSPLLPRNLNRLRRFVANDAQANLEARARSYLGANCAHCHTLYGGGNSAMEFDWLSPREQMRTIGERPVHGDFGLPDARVVAPGAAARSVIVSRVSVRGPGQMPPIGTRLPDPFGTRLLVEWIQSLPTN